jgi:hypothetical protein
MHLVHEVHTIPSVVLDFCCLGDALGLSHSASQPTVSEGVTWTGVTGLQ